MPGQTFMLEHAAWTPGRAPGGGGPGVLPVGLNTLQFEIVQTVGAMCSVFDRLEALRLDACRAAHPGPQAPAARLSIRSLQH